MKKLFTEADIVKLANEGSTVVYISGSDLVTPAARDKINALGLKISDKKPAGNTGDIKTGKFSAGKTAALASDHRGYKVKSMILEILAEAGYKIIDCGTNDPSPCDFTDFASAAAKKVQSGEADFAVIADAVGNASAVTANKFKGIRAAVGYNEFTAASAREHNNANVLCVGAMALGSETIKSVLKTWLNTAYEGGRHQRRLDKLADIEKKNFGG